MKLFIDTANLKDIEEALKRGFVRGITTNPSLLAKEPKTEFEKHIKKIIEIIRAYPQKGGTHLSVEVFSKDPEEILAQALHFRKTFNYEHLSVKIHVGWKELEAIKQLKKKEFLVNCTCCMTVNQAMIAAAAGARYISLFIGRIRDGGADRKFREEREAGFKNNVFQPQDFDPWKVIERTRKLLDEFYPNVEIIAGSMRSADDVKMSGLSGAHIVTVPPKFFSGMINHFKTDEVVGQFLKDFENWLK